MRTIRLAEGLLILQMDRADMEKIVREWKDKGGVPFGIRALLRKGERGEGLLRALEKLLLHHGEAHLYYILLSKGDLASTVAVTAPMGDGEYVVKGEFPDEVKNILVGMLPVEVDGQWGWVFAKATD